jgi:glycogen(starch) synthase
VRILTVGNRYPPQVGGYEVLWQSAVEHLRGRGHEMCVLTTGPAAPGDSAAGIHRELRWYSRAERYPRMAPWRRLRLERHNSGVLDGHLQRFAPDVVAWFAMGGMSMGLIERVRRRGIAATAVVCEHWPAYGPRVDGWTRLLAGRPRLAALSEKRGLPVGFHPDGVAPWLFISRSLRAAVLRELPATDTSVANPGPDPAFSPAPAPPWRWRLLYVGRLDPRKGVDTAIAALPRLPPQATLHIVDAGPTRHGAQLARLARRLGVADRVVFGGAAPRRDLPRIYAEADAVLFPVRWEEPWGLVPLEAMAVGRPVVATGLGGSGEYLRDRENCLVVDVEGGPATLAAAVRELAADQQLRERIRRGGLDTAARFDLASWNEAVERACLRAAERSSGAVAP